MDSAATVAGFLAEAELPPLLPALAYLTGDLSLLRPELRTIPDLTLEEQGGLTSEQQVAVRALAERTLVRVLAQPRRPMRRPSPGELRRISSWATGGGASDAQLEFLEEELALESDDPRAPTWRKAQIAPDRPFNVAIIGAGMSGLLMAHRMQQAGVDYVVLEKNADVGGTWLENSYPGCRVDVTSHAYSYSFLQSDDWPEHYSPQGPLLEYFRGFARNFGLRERVRFNTEVVSAAYDDGAARWRIRLRAAGGAMSEIAADVVVSAVGQLNRPKLPDIAGCADFAGTSFHSSAWDHELDLGANVSPSSGRARVAFRSSRGSPKRLLR